MLPPAPPPHEYNKTFEKFVGNDFSDLVGIVAYGIYKHAKREWATSIFNDHGRAPNADELRAYHATWTPRQIESARQSAAQVLSAYADEVISNEEPRILKDALKGSFWKSVWQSIFANGLYTLMLIALAIILAKAGVDLIGLIRESTQ